MKREIKFRAWDTKFGIMLEEVVVYNNDSIIVVDAYANEKYGDNIDYIELNDAGAEHYCITADFELMQYTGMNDIKNKRGVYESDIYFEEDAHDYGDRRIFFVVTWIAERAAFAMLEISEYNEYVNHGIEVIRDSFECFYYELDQSSFDKMHYSGNVHQNPELLTPTNSIS